MSGELSVTDLQSSFLRRYFIAGLEGSINPQQSDGAAGFNSGRDIRDQGRVPPEQRTDRRPQATGNPEPQNGSLCCSGRPC